MFFYFYSNFTCQHLFWYLNVCTYCRWHTVLCVKLATILFFLQYIFLKLNLDTYLFNIQLYTPKAIVRQQFYITDSDMLWFVNIGNYSVCFQNLVMQIKCNSCLLIRQLKNPEALLRGNIFPVFLWHDVVC